MSFQPLRKRSDIHLARKLWHFLGVLLIIVLHHNLVRSTAIQLITFFAFFSLTLDFLRLKIPVLNRTFLNVFYPFLRNSEKDAATGTSYLLWGTLVLVYFFPSEVVALSLFFLAIADPVASYFGIRFGKDRLVGNKTLQGTLAAFVICTIIAALYFYSKDLMVDRILAVSLLAGLIGAFSELIPIGKLDDNLTFPILSAVALYGLFYVFGGFPFHG